MPPLLPRAMAPASPDQVSFQAPSGLSLFAAPKDLFGFHANVLLASLPHQTCPGTSPSPSASGWLLPHRFRERSRDMQVETTTSSPTAPCPLLQGVPPPSPQARRPRLRRNRLLPAMTNTA